MKETWYIEKPTQEKQILNLLEEHKGEWVPVNWFMRLWIAQYNARIWSLRKKWYQIMQKFDIKNKKHSKYMLTWKPNE